MTSSNTFNEEGQIIVSIKSTNKHSCTEETDKNSGDRSSSLNEMNIALDSAKNLIICIGHNRPTTPHSTLGYCHIPINDATSDFMSNASGTMHGFPSGCFRIRAAGTQTYWTARWAETHQDGNGIDVWPFVGENANEHIFFMNSSGNLCLGGVAVDVIDNSLITAQNRPFTLPWPNPWSHPLPTFTYSRDTRIISVKFHIDPIPSATWPRPHSEWKDKEFVIMARCKKGMRIPRFNEIEHWAPKNSRFSDRWTSRAGQYDKPGALNNLGVEERASVGQGHEELEGMQWVLELA